jgi:transcription initiation factor TFIID TATA-box-binding protein
MLRSGVEIQNVVASVSFDQQLDLETISRTLPTAKYNPEEFPGVIYHARKPKASMLIFSSGKIVCSGMKSERQAKRAASNIAYELKNNGIVLIREPFVEIENIVASADLGVKLSLEDLAYTLEGTFYDPEQFPGLIYRLREPKATFIIFTTGKVVCTGVRRKRDALKALEVLKASLKSKNLLYEP